MRCVVSECHRGTSNLRHHGRNTRGNHWRWYFSGVSALFNTTGICGTLFYPRGYARASHTVGFGTSFAATAASNSSTCTTGAQRWSQSPHLRRSGPPWMGRLGHVANDGQTRDASHPLFVVQTIRSEIPNALLLPRVRD